MDVRVRGPRRPADHRHHPAAILFVALTGCGITDAGSGTGTLFAQVELSGRPDSTQIEAELMARGNPVVGANLVIEDRDRGVTTTLEQTAAGRYRATTMGYARVVELRIVSGDDNLKAVLEGPHAHVITRPENGAIVRRGDFDTLRVQWRAEPSGDADAARVSIEGQEGVELEGDVYEARVPIGGLRNGAHRLAVRRETSIELAGGTTGSRIRTRYQVDNEFVIE